MNAFLKRSVAALFSFMMVFGVCSMTARADVIYVPENSFFEEHQDACSFENRMYIANAPGGTLTCYKSPESSLEKAQLKNGTELYTAFIYEAPSGIRWGYCEFYDAWYPMDYTYAKYDDQQFREDYTIKEESGELDKSYAGKTIYFWNYPGGEVTSSWSISEGGNVPMYSDTFTDENGLNWGFVGYYFGRRNAWVCLEKADVTEEAMYPDGKPVRDTRVIAEPSVDVQPEAGGQGMTLGLILAAVAAVMGGSLFLLFNLKK